MVGITSLLVPILVSAVFVFIASSIIHMVLPFHRKDFQKLPNEDEMMEALRRFGLQPGDYVAPAIRTPAEMKDPAFIEKRNKGPVFFMTVMPGGAVKMGKSLVLWFIYCLVISGFAAYVTGRALGSGAEYLSVFRFAGAAAFAGYALGLPQNSIWMKRKWSTTIKSMIDGLIYGLLTAGTFGWLWPA